MTCNDFCQRMEIIRSPDGAEVVIFCVKLEGYAKGIADASAATKGMQIVRVDRI